MKFMKYLPPFRPKLVQNVEMSQKLLKFGITDISNVSISTLVSKMKYLTLARPKLASKLKLLKIY